MQKYTRFHVRFGTVFQNPVTYTYAIKSKQTIEQSKSFTATNSAAKVRNKEKYFGTREHSRFWHEIIDKSLLACFSRLVAMIKPKVWINCYHLRISCQNL